MWCHALNLQDLQIKAFKWGIVWVYTTRTIWVINPYNTSFESHNVYCGFLDLEELGRDIIFTGKSFSETPFFVHRIFHFMDQIYRFLLFVLPSGSWLAPHACNSDLRVSADPVDVRNDPHSVPCPQATLSKKWNIRSKMVLLKMIYL